MAQNYREWTRADLLNLPGQAASLTLEFKPSTLLTKPEYALKILSKDISALANAEGGTIVIGIQEKRGKSRLATGFDAGIDPQACPPDQLQRLLLSTIQPLISEIRCQAISLADDPQSSVVYVITVPKGSTAYQASDYIYYTRNGAMTVPMPDHLVRLLMQRTSAPHMTLGIGQCEVLPKDQFYEYRFDLIVANTGLVSIHDFVLEIRIQTADDSLQMWAPTMFVDNEEAIRDELISVESMLEVGEDLDDHERHELLHGAGIPFQNGDILRCSFQRIMQILYQVEHKTIFPQDRLTFPGGKWLLTSVPHNIPLRSYQPMLAWTIYVDDGSPCSGILDIAQAFQPDSKWH